MGSDRATQGPQNASAKQSVDASSDKESVKVPGKATLSQALEPTPADLEDVARRAGQRVIDGAGFEYRALPDGSFEATKAPDPAQVGKRVSVDRMPGLWRSLHDLLLAQSASSAPEVSKAPKPGTSLSLGGPKNTGADWYRSLMSPSLQAADGESEETPANGTVQRKETGTFDWQTGSIKRGGGSETYATNGERRATQTNVATTTTDLSGWAKESTKSTTSPKVEVIDVPATAAKAKKELEEEKKLAAQEITNLPNGSPAAKQAAEARIAKLDAAIAAVNAASNDGEALKQLCVQQGLVIEPAYKVVEEATQKDKLEISLWEGSVAKSKQTTDAKTDKEGVTTTTSTSSAISASFAEGKLERETSNTKTTRNADGTSDARTVVPTRKTSVEAGGGELKLSLSETDKHSKTDAAGKPTSSSSSTVAASGAVLAGDDGVGMKSGLGGKKVTTEGKKSSELTGDASVGVTDKGVLGDGSVGYKSSGEKLERQIKMSADGALLVELLPPDEESDQYRIVTTVRAGLGLNGSVGTKEKKTEKEGAASLSGKLSASAKGSATMVYTHAMTLAQAQKYMTAADSAAAGKAITGEYPELDALQKINALAHGENATDPRSVLGNSSSASEMPAGDSMKLSLSASVGAKVQGGASNTSRSGSVDASASGGGGRTVTVSKNSDGNVIISIGFESTAKIGVGLSGTLDGASATVAGSASASDGEEFTFMLDPHAADYQACYDLVLGSWSRDTLNKLAQTEPMKGHVSKRKRSGNHQDEVGGGVGGAGVMLMNSGSRQRSSDITNTPNGAEGTLSGGQSQATSIAVADVNIAGVTHTNTATSTVDHKGTMSTDLQTADSATDLGTTLSNAGRTVKGWFGIQDGKETKASDVLKGALEKTPGERLEELLEKQYTRLSGYKIREADLATIVARAADEQKWMSACKSARVLIPMENLRAALLDPQIDDSLVTDMNDASQVQRAGKVAVAKALADFMEASGAAGMEAIVNVMQNWGARYNVASTAEDLGVRYEWPPSLAKHRVTYEKADQTMSDVPRLAQELIRDPNGNATWRELSDKLIKDLDEVHTAVAESRDIHSDRARAEMLNDISKKKAALISANKYFEQATGMPQKAPDANGPLTKEADAAEKQREGKAGANMFANERVSTLLVDLGVLKQREAPLLAAGRTNASSMSTKRNAHEQFKALCELYEYWVAMVKELRGHYKSAGVAPQTWQVSSGPEAPRKPATEPLVEELIGLQRTADLVWDGGYGPEDLRRRFGRY